MEIYLKARGARKKQARRVVIQKARSMPDGGVEVLQEEVTVQNRGRKKYGIFREKEFWLPRECVCVRAHALKEEESVDGEVNGGQIMKDPVCLKVLWILSCRQWRVWKDIKQARAFRFFFF